MSLTQSIIRQIDDCGFAVSLHRMDAYVEMHAVPLSGEDEIKLARCGDGDDEGACLSLRRGVGRMVGIDWED